MEHGNTDYLLLHSTVSERTMLIVSWFGASARLITSIVISLSTMEVPSQYTYIEAFMLWEP